MADIAMAVKAEPLLFRSRLMYFAHQPQVAQNTVPLHNIDIEFLNTDGVLKIPGGKRKAVIPAVDALGQPFIHKPTWRMAVVADGETLVAGMVPILKLILHDMTIYAGFGIIGQVRCGGCVIQDIRAQPSYHP